MSWPQSLGLGIIFNVGKPLARRLLFQVSTVYTREVKTFSTKTSRDVGMVPSVFEEHVCLHGKINWWKNFRIKDGYHSMLPTSLLENIFSSLVSLLFMECKLHSGNLSPEALEVMQK